MILLAHDPANGVFLLNSVPYQKGKYKYQQRGDNISILEVGREVKWAEISQGNFSDYIQDSTSNPYPDIATLVNDLKTFLYT